MKAELSERSDQGNGRLIEKVRSGVWQPHGVDRLQRDAMGAPLHVELR